MLKNNYQILFYLLLIPFYLMLIVILFSISSGLSIEWIYMIKFIFLNVFGSWLLSYKRNYILNIGGFICFIFFGGPMFWIVFNPPLIGPYYFEVGGGLMIITLGILGLIYMTKKKFEKTAMNYEK